VDSGEIDDPRIAHLEKTLQQDGRDEERALALSSLAYGYFMLAERAAAEDRPDPALVARLETWNALLSRVYADAEDSPVFRTAVRDAALDLHERAPDVPAPNDDCEPDADGSPCGTTSQLLVALRRIDDPDTSSGVRGALGKLIGRMLDDDEPDSAAQPATQSAAQPATQSAAQPAAPPSAND
jgi:hypothetical protein